MTVGGVDAQSSNFTWPAIQECDLLIISSNSIPNNCSAEDSASQESPELLAPVLLLGVSGFLLLDRDAWQALPEINPEPQQLRRAVQVCLEQTAMLRHRAGTGEDREDFLTFLGHEMRSPLTAAKTALEVMQGDLGFLHKEGDAPDPSLKMVEIALRNIRRLHHTVEWSQELLSVSSFGQDCLLRDFATPLLKNFLKEKVSLIWGKVPEGLSVNTDLESLAQLLDQAGRALQYTVPGSQLELMVNYSTGDLSDFDADGEELTDQSAESLNLVLCVQSKESSTESPKVARHGLVSGAPVGKDVAEELRRLVLFVVSQSLCSSLGVGLKVLNQADDYPAIEIQIPLVPLEEKSSDSVAELLPTA